MITINIYTIKQFKEMSGQYELDSKVIRSPQNAYEIVEAVLDLKHESVERFGILTLTTKNAVAGLHVLSMGSLNASIVHPREVFKAALLNNADSIICFHNHPSGDPTPSDEDVKLTKRLMDAGDLIGIEVMDHIVHGYERYISLKEQGFIF